MATRGRKPGSTCRAKCVACGAPGVARSGAGYRCPECRAAGRYCPSAGHWTDTGKDAAGLAVAGAIRDGRLQRPSCFKCADCDRQAQQYDHRDYNKPLDVHPVCRSCNLKRGPAIPMRGSLTRIVKRGGTPYRVRHRVEQLLRVMGHKVEAVAGMPHSITADHWRVTLAQLPEGV